MKLFRCAALALVALAAPGETQQVQDESVFIDEIKKEFLDRVQKCEEGRDWKGLFEHYHHGLRRYSENVVAIAPDRWTSVREYLTTRLSRLPKEAYEYYRFENDGKARHAFEKAREAGSRHDLEKAVEDYFFSSYTGDVLDTLANLAFDEGRTEESLFHWNRLLRLYPDSALPKQVIVARIANACRISRNEAALADLRQYLKKSAVEGTVRVGDKELDLSRYLEAVQIPVATAVSTAPRQPYVLGPEDVTRRRVLGVRNDIRRWVYDFAADRGDPAAQAPAEAAPQVLAGRGGLRGFRRVQTLEGMAAPSFGEFPLFPAYAKVRGKDYVIFTDGSRAVAIDPSRVKGNDLTAGVYWKYPSAAILRFAAGTNPNANSAIGRAYVGVTLEGEFAYIPMASSLQVRPRDNNPQGLDTFEGATAMKCIYIPTGKVVWDTDLKPLVEEMKVVCKGFYDRNFSFSGAPLVQGDRLYVGICTSPVGEQESRVLCLDRKTGRPLWSTFLASLTGSQAAALQWGAGRLPAYQTMMTVQGGMLYVQTNLGIVGALSPVSGSIQWITRYKRSGRRFQNTGGVEPSFFRPANLPFVWRGKLYVLPQDRPELLAFESISGKPEELPAPQTTGSEMEWRNMRHLVGLIDESLVIQGSSSHVLRLTDFRAYGLASSLSMGTGRGLIKDDLIYLPLSANPGATVAGSLGIYDARLTNNIRPWKNLDQIPWKEPNEFGNLLVAGNYVVVATNKISVYTDVETLRNEFAHRLYQSPPHADSLLQFGNTMKENDRLEEAAEAYLGFIRAAEGDARHTDRVQAVRNELHGIFIKRGEEAAGRGDAAKALEYYTYAKSFAWDDKTQADAIKRLAQTYESQKQWKDAVGQYQELIQKGRDLYHRESESVTKLWEHAARRIDAIVAGAPEAYAEVEKQAADALKKVKQDSVEGLRDVMDRFPNSKTAREAFQKMRDTLFKQGKFEKLRALYNDFKDRFKLDLNFDSYRELLELLEKLGDTERLRYELARFADRFGPESIGVDGNEETVKDYVERRLLEMAHRLRLAQGLRGPLNRIGEMEPLRQPADHGAVPGHRPLCPLGIAPPDFGPNLELFRLGSSVELWDLKAKRRLWARAHPGGYLGVVFGEDPNGVQVLSVKSGSPAQKAGIDKGDVLLALDGAPVTAADLSAKLAALTPGASVDLRYRRGEQQLKAKVELGNLPAEFRPSIVGASFTRDYSLAVAWEDGVASIDLDTGEIQWTFRSLRERFHVRGFHATDGRLYLLETARHDRDGDVFRSPSTPATTPFKPEDAHHRLYSLSDFTGEVIWARAFGFDPKNPFQESQTTFFGPYLSDQVRFLQMGSRAGNREWVLWSIAASGSGQPMQRPLLGQVLAHAVDEASGIFYYVADMMSDRRERILYSISLDPSRKDFKPVEIPLHQAKYMPQNYAVCSLSVSRDYLALVVSPPQPDAEHRLWVWTTADGKDRTLSLLPDRTLPVNRPAGFGLGEDGMLYVYNVPRQKSAAGNPGRSYLTAFRLGVPAGTDPVAWDAVAPHFNHAAAPVFSPEAGNYAVLASTRASLPGDMGETSVAVVYDKQAEGYVRLRNSELFAPLDGSADPFPPAVVWRGRIYIMARQGTLIFGD